LALLAFSVALSGAKEPLVIAHRGASADAPENTLAAFRLAWEQGADGVEGDFRMTRDGKIVCIHDHNTARISNVNLLVKKSTLAQLRALDVGAWKGAKFRGEQIPTLLESLAALPEGKRFFVEIKSGVEIVASLKRDIAKALEARPRLAEQIVFISFDKAVVAACRGAWPEIKANWLVSFEQNKVTRRWGPGRGELLRGLKASRASGVGVRDVEHLVTEVFVVALRGAGFEPHCWTVNEESPARRLQALGFDSITTDVPGKLRQWLKGEVATP
jgi:glycerophosphoryl diester phosphodiesterase